MFSDFFFFFRSQMHISSLIQGTRENQKKRPDMFLHFNSRRHSGYNHVKVLTSLDHFCLAFKAQMVRFSRIQWQESNNLTFYPK